MTGVSVSCQWSSPQISSQGKWGSCQEAHDNRPIFIGQDVRLGIGAYSTPTKAHRSSAAIPQKVHCKAGIKGQCVHWRPELCSGVGSFTSALGKGLLTKSVLGNRVIQQSREGQGRRNLHNKRERTVCALGGSGGRAAEARGPSASSSQERSRLRTNAQAVLLKRLPKILSLAALCVLLLPSRAAWATSGSITHPSSYARFSLPTTVSSLKEAFRVASPKELLASAWTGLVAGCLHTLTGPDHLAALAPMSIGRTRLQSAWMGALWGCGHDAGQLLFGLLFLLLKDRLHMDLLSQWSGVVIGVTLCGIGALGLHESRQLSASPETSSMEELQLTSAYTGVSDVIHAEDYRSDDAATSAPKATASSSKPFGMATFITGIFHGFQPDALIMILPALALPSKLAGLSFLVTFLLGTILAMGSYTACIGASCEMLGERVPWINEKLSQVSSSISVLVGIALISSNAFGFKIL